MNGTNHPCRSVAIIDKIDPFIFVNVLVAS